MLSCCTIKKFLYLLQLWKNVENDFAAKLLLGPALAVPPAALPGAGARTAVYLVSVSNRVTPAPPTH